MNSIVKFVYFDVGGVLVKDFSKNDKWLQLKKDLGVTEVFDSEFEKYWDNVELELNVGKTVESLIPEINRMFELNIQLDAQLTQEFVSRFEKNEGISRIVFEVATKFRVGLLTNMYPNMLKMIKAESLLPNSNFDVIVDSSVVGCDKPNIEIYKIAEEKSGFLPEEILFVDNTKKNIDAAIGLGWKGYLFDSSDYVKSNKELGIFLTEI